MRSQAPEEDHSRYTARMVVDLLVVDLCKREEKDEYSVLTEGQSQTAAKRTLGQSLKMLLAVQDSIEF